MIYYILKGIILQREIFSYFIAHSILKDLAIITHEFLHVLGASHEHTRPDRDEHIKVNWENLDPNWIIRYAFWKTSWVGESQGEKLCKDQSGPVYDDCVSGEEVERHEDLRYDMFSIMHYSPNG